MVSFIISKSTTNSSIQRSSSNINGLIINKNDNEPLDCVSIAIYNAKTSQLMGNQLTDAKGNFDFSKLPAGKYYIVTFLVGFQKHYISDITLSRSGRIVSLGKIFLTPSTEYGIIEIKADRI